ANSCDSRRAYPPASSSPHSCECSRRTGSCPGWPTRYLPALRVPSSSVCSSRVNVVLMAMVMDMRVVTMALRLLPGGTLGGRTCVHHATLALEAGQVFALAHGAPFKRVTAPQVEQAGDQDE